MRLPGKPAPAPCIPPRTPPPPNATTTHAQVGLDAAGKTTILYKLALGETVNTTATVGSNVETFSHKNLSLEVWDLGGQATLRTFWSPYYKGADAVIVVVDSTDRARLHVAKVGLR